MRATAARKTGPLAAPEGFRYAPGLLQPAEERDLLELISDVPLKEFEFHGYLAKRRVRSFGWGYDFETEKLIPAPPIPAFLLPLRERAAGFANLDPEELAQALITEYPVGAGINWHMDKAVFGDVIGISLLSPCIFRLRRDRDSRWERYSLTAEPRSAYLLRGPVRWEWEHSIPGVGAHRYSITFRTLLQAAGR